MERWGQADLTGNDWDLGVVVSPALETDAVVALGITTPAGDLPLDIRFWKLGAVATPSRSLGLPIGGPDPGSWLWLPPRAADTTLGSWPAGTYRIDVLLGSRITRLVTVVPGGLGSSQPAAASPLPPPPDLDVRLGTLSEGPVAVADGRVIRIEAALSQPLDELEAWLGSTRSGSEPLVGLVASPDVSALGVVLPAGARDPHLGIGMLAPIGGSVRAPIEIFEPDPAGADDLSPDAGPTPASALSASAVLERAGTGSSFAAGVYEITASWTGADEKYRAGVWHVEIAPSTPPTPPGSPLVALARWTGRNAIPAATRGEPIVTDLDAVGGPGTGTCGIEASVTSADRLLAVAAPGATIVGAHLSGPDGGGPVRTRLMAGQPDTGGLTLVALPSDGLTAGRYRLDLDRASGTPAAYEICVG